MKRSVKVANKVERRARNFQENLANQGNTKLKYHKPGSQNLRK